MKGQTTTTLLPSDQVLGLLKDQDTKFKLYTFRHEQRQETVDVLAIDSAMRAIENPQTTTLTTTSTVTTPAPNVFTVNGGKVQPQETVTATTQAPGGIDLNRANMQMNVKKEGQGVQMTFDAAMVARIKREGFDGLEFRIQSIIPVTNLPLFLGLEQTKQQELARAGV